MKNPTQTFLFILIFMAISCISTAQEKHFQSDFLANDFAKRRATIFDAIGSNSFALIQGTRGIVNLRQTNSFYYLCGIEIAHAYLLLDGESKRSTLYLPASGDPGKRDDGETLSLNDAEIIKELTGVERVRGIEFLSVDLVRLGLYRPPALVLYTPLSPAETGNDSRDELLAGQAFVASDPWDGQASREAQFQQLLQQRFPQFQIKDLSPILDAMRLIKSKKEIEVIRKATEIAGLSIIEAMKSTSAGVYEYQLDAAAKYIFYLHGSQGDGYPSIIGGGTNSFMGHYSRKTDPLNDGDLLLMDYAPDYHYYTSDVTRMWPVNGKYSQAQRKLCEYILAYRDALFKYVKPGVTSNDVLAAAARDMETYLSNHTFENPAHLKAVQNGIKFRGHFQHPVGMTVHDVGRVHGIPLQPGMIFTIDPMIWIPEERLYVRIEDMALVTEEGVENLSAFVPSGLDDIERTMKEKGLLQFRPANSLPLKK